MSFDHAADPITAAISSIEDVTSHVETTCARVGDYLGRGHTTFQDISSALTIVSQDLSDTKSEGASVALQSISARLNGFAEAAPAESALLGKIGASVEDSSALLQALIGQIELIAIIARSARIEAASLNNHQASFLDFTREVFDLAHGIRTAVEACAQDQVRLTKAIDAALRKQREFERKYSQELMSVSVELISVYADIKRRQIQSAQLADSTRSGTMRIATAVGDAIVSLQAGDSVRQRLEHVCEALGLVVSSRAGFAPSLQRRVGEIGQAADAICMLQVDQLKSVVPAFEADIASIRRSLASLSSDASGILTRGRSLVAGKGTDVTSSLSIMRQKLTRASVLISACERARTSVDQGLSIVTDALIKFRGAFSELGETILDIMLVAMNAGLKAGHLGEQGRTFVVIATELKATADKISAIAALLSPKLDLISDLANDLRDQRDDGTSAHAAENEPSISDAIGHIEAGNAQLEQLMSRMVDEGAEFDSLLASAEVLLAALAEKTGTLPGAIDMLTSAYGSNEMQSAVDREIIECVLDDLFAAYSMTEERDIHRAFLRSNGLGQHKVVASPETNSEEADEVLFF